MDNIKYEILEHIGSIGENRELNIVSWNGRPPKYDIREWNEDHTRMTKGITLTEEQVKALYGLLKERYEK